MHCEKLKVLMKIRSFWWKESCSLKIKVSELYFKDKEFDEKVLVFYKDKVSDESAGYV